jgi:hypothetical protein
MPVVWSNVYVPFKEVVLFERALGEWLVKDESANQLQVSVASERVGGKFRVTLNCVVAYDVRNSNKGLVIDIRPPT